MKSNRYLTAAALACLLAVTGACRPKAERLSSVTRSSGTLPHNRSTKQACAKPQEAGMKATVSVS